MPESDAGPTARLLWTGWADRSTRQIAHKMTVICRINPIPRAETPKNSRAPRILGDLSSFRQSPCPHNGQRMTSKYGNIRTTQNRDNSEKFTVACKRGREPADRNGQQKFSARVAWVVGECVG
jgi:hypothetical protein